DASKEAPYIGCRAGLQTRLWRAALITRPSAESRPEATFSRTGRPRPRSEPDSDRDGQELAVRLERLRRSRNGRSPDVVIADLEAEGGGVRQLRGHAAAEVHAEVGRAARADDLVDRDRIWKTHVPICGAHGHETYPGRGGVDG